MKNVTTQFLIFALLFLMSACASPVRKQVYFSPSPPVIDQETEAIKKAELERLNRIRIAEDLERKRRLEEARRQTEEERISKLTMLRFRKETIQEVQDSVDDFQAAIANSSCGTAEQKAHEIMRFASSEDNKLEADLLTATCLCHLEKTGDVSRFLQCGEELDLLTQNHPYLSKETQLILSLQPYISQATNKNRDTRVDMSLARGIKSILTTQTK